MVFGAAEEAKFGATHGGFGNEARVSFGRLFGETFSGEAAFFGVAAVATVAVLAELFIAVASFMGKND